MMTFQDQILDFSPLSGGNVRFVSETKIRKTKTKNRKSRNTKTKIGNTENVVLGCEISRVDSLEGNRQWITDTETGQALQARKVTDQRYTREKLQMSVLGN